jgi:hypothetical protein
LYMGHVSIVSTANYLRCTPGLMGRASERFEQYFAGIVAAGAS